MVVPAWVGHLNPMTSLGRALQTRGHDVAVLSFPESKDRVQKAGLEFRCIGARTFPFGEWERRTRELSVLRGLAASRYTIRWLDSVADVMLTELPTALSEGKFNDLVMDQVCFGADCAADSLGIPLTMACNALPVHFQPDVPVHTETWAPGNGWLHRVRNRLVQRIVVRMGKSFLDRIRADRRRRGRDFDVWHHFNEVPPTLAQVAQVPACLDFPRRHAPDHFHNTGPWHEPKAQNGDGFDWSWLDGRPLIYASLGTLQNGQDHLYQLILDACATLPMQVVLTRGREGGKPLPAIPSNAKVLGYGPQTALLQRASLVITHAGMNTTLEALTQGLPLVALPIGNEQPGIAARIRYAGVGDWLAIRGLKPPRLRSMVEHVHQTASYRERARECARELARVGGLTMAASIIEKAIQTGRRVTRGDLASPS